MTDINELAANNLKTPKRALITSALPYANGHVHIGHLAGAYLPADIFTRYLKQKGVDAIYVCGSDEHGVPITVSAEREDVTPQEIIDRYHNANASAFADALVDFDIYSRTSLKEHHELSQHYFMRLLENGHIEKKVTSQLYCDNCARFLPDRYVEGTCHHCGASGARGDQCDACGHVMDALLLGEPECKICGKHPVARETTHWFLKLGNFSDKLQSWIESHPEWRANVRAGAMGWIKEGLRERGITRDLSWGIKVPLEEAEGKVIYVWFDAPIGYQTFTKIWAEKNNRDWQDFWQSDDCKIYHFIGKDNIPFHAITWPAVVMGMADGTELPHAVVSNEYLNFGEGKFSKSLGRVIRISDFVREFGTDALRYHLCAVAPEGSDSEFTWEDFRQRYGELADTLGNFCLRGLSFAIKRMGGVIPDSPAYTERDLELFKEIESARVKITDELSKQRFKQALGSVMELARNGNRHFDEREPWVTRKTDPADCEAAITASLHVVRALSGLIAPFLPEASSKLASMLGDAALRTENGSWDVIGTSPIEAGTKLGETIVLFPKMDDAAFEEKVKAVMQGS